MNISWIQRSLPDPQDLIDIPLWGQIEGPGGMGSHEALVVGIASVDAQLTCFTVGFLEDNPIVQDVFLNQLIACVLTA